MGNPVTIRQARLDPLGGIAGDMFCAAVLDACPELAPDLAGILALLPVPPQISVRLEVFNDGVLTGKRLAVEGESGHGHRSWREVRGILQDAGLPEATSRHALAIFARLADAEGRVHGIEPDGVTFHEVGAWDSIIDIVLAAWLIDRSGVQSWDIAPVPTGSGRVQSQHGPLPVPAPATVHLLGDIPVIDDGIGGERVTPTGAAILAHLQGDMSSMPLAGRMVRQGFGFGSRRLPGISNALRVVLFEGERSSRTDQVCVVAFEIDDQTAEDLAIGLDRLRAQDGVLDVLQMPVTGKKGRLATSVRMLVQPDMRDWAIDRCFVETTTLGVRWSLVSRVVLERESRQTPDGSGVKLARRPDGTMTAKAESNDVATSGGAAARAHARAHAEAQVMNDDD